ncbi:hypothetical protein IFM89_021371 [Coptis chinensis]|uniref:DUF7722 domain-containing protein n=1 Tax=Coptis chinensis TaxID=261450 RepID=A0A835IBT5_9MAGN|nr:hypothetical protein IFM89_021371 [Coptis chinensis]
MKFSIAKSVAHHPHTFIPNNSQIYTMTEAGCRKSSYNLNGLLTSGTHSSRGRCEYFEMPLHYPRYKKEDYETMPEWQLDCLLNQYGLPVIGDVAHKRNFAMGAFLWPSQINKK